jgi:hypothetical protein
MAGFLFPGGTHAAKFLRVREDLYLFKTPQDRHSRCVGGDNAFEDRPRVEDHGRHVLRALMSVEMKRVFPRIAGCCVLVLFVAGFAPSGMPADEFAPPPHFDSTDEPDGMLCMDDMETEPYTDVMEPSPVSHIDGGCSVSELPVST